MLPFSPEELEEFIKLNSSSSISDLVLKAAPENRSKVLLLAEQMEARNRLRSKVPEWSVRFDLYLPPKENLAQASNTETAEYKSADISGSLLDLTAGSGIDAWKMGKNASSITLVDPNEELVERTSFNLHKWGLEHTFFIGTAEDFLDQNNESFDWIYLDPSRRSEDGNRTVALHRMLPDIPKIWEEMHRVSDSVKMKLSPLFDLHAIINELPYVYKIEVLAKKGEVKEVVVTSSKSNKKRPSIVAVEVQKELAWKYEFPSLTIDASSVNQGVWSTYIYDPSSALIKAGLAEVHASENDLIQPVKNVQLFTHSSLVKGYPGRVFKVVQIGKPYKLKNLPDRLSIVTKDYFDKPEVIRKKLKVGESDSDFLFAVSKQKSTSTFIHAVKVN